VSDPAISVTRPAGTVTILDDDTDAEAPPAAPQQVVAVPGPAAGDIEVSWQPGPGASADTYSLEESIDGGPWTVVGTGIADAAFSLCCHLTATHQYRVVAHNAFGSSPASEPSEPLTTTVGTPTDVQAAFNPLPG